MTGEADWPCTANPEARITADPTEHLRSTSWKAKVKAALADPTLATFNNILDVGHAAWVAMVMEEESVGSQIVLGSHQRFHTTLLPR